MESGVNAHTWGFHLFRGTFPDPYERPRGRSLEPVPWMHLGRYNPVNTMIAPTLHLRKAQSIKYCPEGGAGITGIKSAQGLAPVLRSAGAHAAGCSFWWPTAAAADAWLYRTCPCLVTTNLPLIASLISSQSCLTKLKEPQPPVTPIYFQCRGQHSQTPWYISVGPMASLYKRGGICTRLRQIPGSQRATDKQVSTRLGHSPAPHLSTGDRPPPLLSARPARNFSAGPEAARRGDHGAGHTPPPAQVV